MFIFPLFLELHVVTFPIQTVISQHLFSFCPFCVLSFLLSGILLLSCWCGSKTAKLAWLRALPPAAGKQRCTELLPLTGMPKSVQPVNIDVFTKHISITEGLSKDNVKERWECTELITHLSNFVWIHVESLMFWTGDPKLFHYGLIQLLANEEMGYKSTFIAHKLLYIFNGEFMFV